MPTAFHVHLRSPTAQRPSRRRSKTEAEERLKLDTAIKAVELFKSAAGAASPSESAGALFALVRLGQFHFALALLEELWPKDLI
jgi:hypothetical protein